jgi:hypothetical protein
VDAWSSLQTDGRVMMFIKDIDLREVPDAEQQAVKVNNVSCAEIPDFLFGKW